MRSAKTAILLLFLLFTTPVLAQDRPVDWTLWGSMVDMQGDNDFGEFSMKTDDGMGLGLSANFFISERLSAEIAIFSIHADADMTFDVFEFELGRVELVPVTLGLQYHFAGQSRWDPYIGAGVAWVSGADLESDDLDLLGIGVVEIDDEVSFFGNAGLGYQFVDHVGLVVDLRYIQYEPTATSTATGVAQDFELSPFMASLGIRVRF